jgi:hypothetical protein
MMTGFPVPNSGIGAFFVEYHFITRALVFRSATANHLCEELYGLQAFRHYYRINLQNNGVLLAANALLANYHSQLRR